MEGKSRSLAVHAETDRCDLRVRRSNATQFQWIGPILAMDLGYSYRLHPRERDIDRRGKPEGALDARMRRHANKKKDQREAEEWGLFG